MRLLAIADVNHMGEEAKMSIARFLTVRIVSHMHPHFADPYHARFSTP